MSHLKTHAAMVRARLRRRRMLAGGLLVASVAGLCCAPLSASATSTGKCIWYDFDIQPRVEGAPSNPSEDCALHVGWTPEASYYWTDEALVIYEPQSSQFDYSAFSGLNPFSGDGFSLRKANELFPDTSGLSAALEKVRYAQDAMTAKARALDARRGLKTSDDCNFIPALASDADIEADNYWLPPSPTPDGSVGSYTYSLAINLTSDQRVAVLAALVVFEAARAGSFQPKLVEWKSGDANPPVITFQNSPDGLDDSTLAETAAVSVTKGRHNLDKWVSGNINLSPDDGAVGARTIVHEILHVYGFAHLSFETDKSIMSPTAAPPSWYGEWVLDREPTPTPYTNVDACTKEGIQNAAPPE